MPPDTAKSGSLDAYDHRILAVLSREGRIPVTELAGRVGLSKTPCQVRMKKLEAAGYIRGYRAVLDAVRLGRSHVSFVQVRLSATREAALGAFNKAVQSVPEIEECHMIAGGFDYLLKVRSANIEDYRRVLGEVISTLPHVAGTSTHVSMEAVKDVSDGL
ncbi:Lrp/AsnC ligand binding domain-containing protein [Roseibacterium sp. SDUM158017]|uniref:Lrp/AsnC family transcriptional regulator n=1 Tax=Roseicyclus salinarum TaxID=3036773 RepID=UPI002415073D|nr:Lrp/AsnC ligand binding domain-containing protein [Roseibacterium sp. SDUM158017]MDG4648513.1 Lrp/AsnC ligand binding domain-containing protein [Roseibacterium sp. SDUM158017]